MTQLFTNLFHYDHQVIHHHRFLLEAHGTVRL